MDSTIETFVNLRVADQSLMQSKSTTENTTWVIIPFKDQESANIVKTQLKDLNVKFQTIVQPVFTSCKIAQAFPTSEQKPQLIDQQCVVYNFKCDHCDAGYVGYIRGHLLYALMDIEARPRPCTSIMIIDTQAGFQMTFTVVLMCWKKCQNNFDCFINEMFLMKQLQPC